MWGASARAHVHTSFERWCLLARSSIADQGVILVIIIIITSGARSAERVLLWFKGENLSMRGPTRPDPTQPDPITLLRSLYLWNGLTDSRSVFFFDVTIQ